MKTVFYFTADWCQPCKKVRPIVEELNRETVGVTFQIIDVDMEGDLVKTFEITSVPTFILFENKQQINRITGAQTKEKLNEFINYKKDIQENV
jgi:thioredoxin-like negative regulator of GroEL